MSEQQLAGEDSINLGVALGVVDSFIRIASATDLAETPEYVAARCVMDRLIVREEPSKSES